MDTLNCYEVDHETVDISEETGVAGATQVRLNLPPITDDDLPTVSIVVPTQGRPEFFELVLRNWERIDYPREKLEMIVCDDTPGAKKPKITDKQIRYYVIPKKVSIGEKRNLLANAAKHEYIVHFDDDDFYEKTSVACRIRILLEYQKKIKKDACFGCTKVLCLDLISNQMFEAFDSSVEGLPATLSESTMAYPKRYWNKQRFDNGSKFAECLPFIKGRTDTICTGPSVFVVTQFTHSKNTVQRWVLRSHVSEYNSIRFENNLSVLDSKIFNNIRAKVIQKMPTYREAIEFTVKFREEPDLKKLVKEYGHLNNDIKANPLVIGLYQERIASKTETSGKDVIYYCGPGSYFNFRAKWNPNSKQLGGSEEAVVNLSRELSASGYNVTVYCVLDGPSKAYGNVKYKPYYEWIPKDLQDLTIIWRDPSICRQEIRSKHIYLDLHDAINPDWIKDLDKRVRVMTKSKYHSTILKVSKTATNVPNGIYTNPQLQLPKVDGLMVCTSSPDRCLRALLRALPLIRKEIPTAQIHWAYGFSSSIDGCGGMEKNSRTKGWVEESRRLISNTPGFTDLGRLSQTEVNQLYAKADLFIYPTRFPEIDCISLTKALSFGCIPVVTPSGAVAEKLGIGEQYAHLTGSQIDYSLEEGPEFDKFVKAVVKVLKTPRSDQYRTSLADYANAKYDWGSVVKQWIKTLQT